MEQQTKAYEELMTSAKKLNDILDGMINESRKLLIALDDGHDCGTPEGDGCEVCALKE